MTTGWGACPGCGRVSGQHDQVCTFFHTPSPRASWASPDGRYKVELIRLDGRETFRVSEYGYFTAYTTSIQELATLVPLTELSEES